MSSDGIKRGVTAVATGGMSETVRAGKKIVKALTPEFPDIPTAQDPPKTEDQEVQAASAKERKLLRLRRGRQSTILSRPKLQQSGGTLG